MARFIYLEIMSSSINMSFNNFKVIISNSSYDRRSSKDESDCSSTRKHILCKDLDEQRLLAYKKEDPPWKGVSDKFPDFSRGKHALEHDLA